MVLPVMKPTLQEDDGDHPMTTTNDEIYGYLPISEIVLPVMKPTMQDDDGDFPLPSIW